MPAPLEKFPGFILAGGHKKSRRVAPAAFFLCWRTDQKQRSASFSLMLPIALAGLRPFGQVAVQFMMVWQR